MTRLAWWHCFAGIAGDMALGSLIDAGADLALIERELVGLPIGGWSLEAGPVLKGGLACTRLVVRARETSVVRTHAHIVGLITEARLPPRARQRALDTFARLAEVEGRLHRRPPAQAHFHEVGGIDAIIDIVGTCVALEILGVDRIASSAVAQGTGVIRTAHGLLPNPSPAVVGLLADAGAPTYGTDRPAELTTPTGAALLATLADRWGPMPAMTVEASGFGAGSRELDGMPNAVQVVIGTVADVGAEVDGGQPIQLLETNVDDVTGEVLAHTVDRLLAAGAHDAWITSVTGKKGRPAHVVSVICDPALASEVRTILATETGTLGVRSQGLARWVSPRGVHEVLVDGHPIRVKRGPSRVKAEHDDVARVARLMALPLHEIARRAENEAHRQPPED
ncbi:MAG: nickel pincer cofactor biosynthesis protein LarC [Acidimicrobiales bacterium]